VHDGCSVSKCRLLRIVGKVTQGFAESSKVKWVCAVQQLVPLLCTTIPKTIVLSAHEF
jgi:hypothetical protein